MHAFVLFFTPNLYSHCSHVYAVGQSRQKLGGLGLIVSICTFRFTNSESVWVTICGLRSSYRYKSKDRSDFVVVYVSCPPPRLVIARLLALQPNSNPS